jgi:hypothetical protein
MEVIDSDDGVSIHVVYCDMTAPPLLSHGNPLPTRYLVPEILASGQVLISIDSRIVTADDIEEDARILHRHGVRGTLVLLEDRVVKPNIIYGYELTGYGVWYCEYSIKLLGKVFRG